MKAMAWLREGGLLMSVVVLVGMRLPHPDPWALAIAATAAGFVGLATWGERAWRRLATLSRFRVHGAVALALLPSPTAWLAWLPWPVAMVCLLAFLHLGSQKTATRAPALGRGKATGPGGPVLRRALVLGILTLAAVLPSIWVIFGPEHLVSAYEFRRLGAPLATAAFLATGMVAWALLRRSWQPAPPEMEAST